MGRELRSLGRGNEINAAEEVSGTLTIVFLCWPHHVMQGAEAVHAAAG